MTDTKKDKKRVLFVCLGNICRSPAAEGIFQGIVAKNNLSEEYTVDSAGTAGYHDGDLPDRRMRKHGAQRGYNFDSISRKFILEDYLDFDYIITMDDSNYHNVLRLSPDIESRHKVYKMIEFIEDTRYDHIPDPYYEGAEGFELVLDLLEDGCLSLFQKIEKGEL